MKQMMKDAMILFLITLISGAALGLVYEVTKEPIAQQEQKAKNEAYQNVFEAAEDFTELTEEAYSPDALTAFVKENGFDASIDGVAQALSGDGSVLGYVITVTDHEGYGGGQGEALSKRNGDAEGSGAFPKQQVSVCVRERCLFRSLQASR